MQAVEDGGKQKRDAKEEYERRQCKIRGFQTLKDQKVQDKSRACIVTEG